MKRRWSLGLRALVIAVVIAGLWWFVRGISWADLGRALGRAMIWPLVIAAALNFVCLWGKAACWRIMLAPDHVVSTARLMRYTIAAFAASAIAPARAGEVLRLWELKRRDGVPVSATAAVALAEKLLDGVTMLILVAPVPWLLPGLPRWVDTSIAVLAGVALAAFIALYVAIGRVGDASSARSWFSRFLAGMHVLRSPQRLSFAMGTLMIVWAADAGELLCVSHAVGISLSVPATILVLFSLNVAIAVPSTPASVGALEVGMLAAMRVLGIQGERALAFALLYHALQVLPLIAVGLALELRLVLGREPRVAEVGEVSDPLPAEHAPDPTEARSPR